ncbi:multiple antibiotic resistance protein [Bradyrhizobium sp. USDA 4532]|nr:multiple antibiotic resistance protein [Bradyrhizobium sp. USDA 4545]MCP1923366.1 multiple antibiotic resistance protein [Bradyrhizobium sp. USDA 4532]
MESVRRNHDALTNPVGAIPVFLAITRQARSANIHRIIVLACTAVAVFFVGAAVLGKQILGFFNVGLDDFRIAGGLLALVIALEMFQAQYGKFLQSTGVDSSEVDIHGMAITPFAFPLLVGPAEVGIMITLSNDNPGWLSKALLAAASIIATFLIGLTLWTAAAIERFLGKTGDQRYDPHHGAHCSGDRRELHYDWPAERIARIGRLKF